MRSSLRTLSFLIPREILEFWTDSTLVTPLFLFSKTFSEYSNWIDVLRLQLCASLAGVETFESQAKRAEELARLDRAKTSCKVSLISLSLSRPFFSRRNEGR